MSRTGIATRIEDLEVVADISQLRIGLPCGRRAQQPFLIPTLAKGDVAARLMGDEGCFGICRQR